MIAELLITKGADQNVKNDRGLTPYDLAVENRNDINSKGNSKISNSQSFFCSSTLSRL